MTQTVQMIIKEAIDALEPMASLSVPKNAKNNAGMWLLYHKDIETAKEAVLSLRRLEIAEDMVSVPVVPTREMQDEGAGFYKRTGWRAPLKPGQRVSSTQYDDLERAENCYSAMLSARPETGAVCLRVKE